MRCGDGVAQGRRASCRFSASRRSVATRFSVGELSGGEPHDNHHSPHLSLLYGAARRGPTSRVGLGVPDQDARQGSSLPLGQLTEIDTNILPLNLILYF